MVRDIPSEIIKESIRRQMNQTVDEIGEIAVDVQPNCPMWGVMNSEQAKRMAAMSIVMTRIIQSANWN